MTDEAYKKAIELHRSIEILSVAREVISESCPNIIFQPEFDDVVVDFAKLDEKTAEQLREAIKSAIDKREEEIHKEVKAL